MEIRSPLQHHLQKNLPAIFLAVTALLLFMINISNIWDNPFFLGDGGFRLDNADQIIVHTGKNRVWLPFLQMHIWLLYKCGAPYWAFKLIPVFYSFVAALFLGLLTRRILRQVNGGLLFAVLVMICFSFQPLIKLLSLNLFQEIVEIALLYILLYGGMLNLEKKWSILIIATFALLTRDSSFVYLLTITLINYKKILSDTKYIYSFLWVWSIPVIWLSYYLFKLGHFSKWPWMVNTTAATAKHHFAGLSNLLYALQTSGVYYFVFELAVVAFIIFLFSRGSKKAQGSFETDFKIFSLFSLAIIYALIVLMDPWQATFGNRRMLVPLLAHMYIWAGILFKEIDECPAQWRIFLRIILISGLMFTNFGQNKGKGHLDNYEKLHFFNTLKSLKKNLYPDHKPMVCIVARNYWDNNDKSFVASTLYMNRKYIPPNKFYSFEKDVCDVLIAPSWFVLNDPRFFYYDKLDLYVDTTLFILIDPKYFFKYPDLTRFYFRRNSLWDYKSPYTIYVRGYPSVRRNN